MRISNYLSTDCFFSVKEQIVVSLTQQQKKILLVSIVIITALTAMYLLLKKRTENLPLQGRNINEHLKNFPKHFTTAFLDGVSDIDQVNFNEIATHIHTLYLQNTKITDTQLSTLPSTIKEIQLANNSHITDEGMKKLPTTVEKIGLMGCPNITLKGIGYLRDGVQVRWHKKA